MNGEEWYRENAILQHKLGILIHKFNEIKNSGGDVEEREYRWSLLTDDFQSGFFRMQTLNTAAINLETTDPYFPQVRKEYNHSYTRAQWELIRDYTNATISARQNYRIRTTKNWPGEVVEGVADTGKAIQDILDRIMEFLEKYMPWILGGGLALIILRLLTFIPSKR